MQQQSSQYYYYQSDLLPQSTVNDLTKTEVKISHNRSYSNQYSTPRIIENRDPIPSRINYLAQNKNIMINDLAYLQNDQKELASKMINISESLKNHEQIINYNKNLLIELVRIKELIEQSKQFSSSYNINQNEIISIHQIIVKIAQSLSNFEQKTGLLWSETERLATEAIYWQNQFYHQETVYNIQINDMKNQFQLLLNEKLNITQIQNSKIDDSEYKNRIKILEDKCFELEKGLKIALNDKDSMKIELEGKNQHNVEIIDKLKKIKIENEEKIIEISKKLEQLIIIIDDKNKELDYLQKNNEKIKKNAPPINIIDNSKYEKEINGLKTQIENLLITIKELEIQLNNNNLKHKNEIIELNKQINVHIDKIKELETQSKSKKSILEKQYNTQIEEIRTEYERESSQRLNDVEVKYEAKIKVLETELMQKNSKIEENKLILSEKDNEIKLITSNLKKIVEENEKFKLIVEEKDLETKRQLEESQSELDLLKKKVKNNEENQLKVNSEKNKLESQIKQLKEEVEGKTEEVNGIVNLMNERSEELEKLQKNIKELKEENDQLKKKCQKFEGELDNKKEEIILLNKEIENLNVSNENYKQRIIIIDAEMTSKNKELMLKIEELSSTQKVYEKAVKEINDGSPTKRGSIVTQKITRFSVVQNKEKEIEEDLEESKNN